MLLSLYPADCLLLTARYSFFSPPISSILFPYPLPWAIPYMTDRSRALCLCPYPTPLHLSLRYIVYLYTFLLMEHRHECPIIERRSTNLPCTLLVRFLCPLTPNPCFCIERYSRALALRSDPFSVPLCCPLVPLVKGDECAVWCGYMHMLVFIAP